jgi:hypothetical protein
LEGEKKMSDSKPMKISSKVIESLSLWHQCAAIVLSREGMIDIVSEDEVAISGVKI